MLNPLVSIASSMEEEYRESIPSSPNARKMSTNGPVQLFYHHMVLKILTQTKINLAKLALQSYY